MANTTPEELPLPTPQAGSYDESSIVSLEWHEHIRLRPGMYIGKLGDGSNFDDGIYVLLKEVIDNGIDEHMSGHGSRIEVTLTDLTVSVRDYGRGIPLGKIADAVGKVNTGGKYNSSAFLNSIGQNGVGVKAVNALSSSFVVRSVRDGQAKQVTFSKGLLVDEGSLEATDEPDGTFVEFTPDASLFRNYAFRREFIEPLLKNYAYLNTGLTLTLNGERFHSRGGLVDLLKDNISHEPLYEPIRLRGEGLEVVLTHVDQYGEEYYTFVNSQHTTQGGTHLTAFKEATARTIKEFFKANFEYSDIRSGMVAAVSLRMNEPMFESQTKIKLGSESMGPEGPSVKKFIGDFMKKELDDYLHKNPEVKDVILKKVQQSERERKAMAGSAKMAREKAKKINLNNRKLLDCRIHLNDTKGEEDKKLASSIFITEGDSAAGSITKIRDVESQAVFSLRGKPLNSYGMTQRIVYQNEEFNLLQAALNIEDGIEGLRYNRVIIATDADVDGMHIRMLLLTFFLQFFPDLVKKGHVYVLQTPLFRVRDKRVARRSAGSKAKAAPKGGSNDGGAAKATRDVYYCYSDEERLQAIEALGDNAEITRFKGLGEISPEEFQGFIGPEMRADRVKLHRDDAVADVLRFYMGKNSPQRQSFIIDNLVVEDDSQIA